MNEIREFFTLSRLVYIILCDLKEYGKCNITHHTNNQAVERTAAAYNVLNEILDMYEINDNVEIEQENDVTLYIRDEVHTVLLSDNKYTEMLEKLNTITEYILMLITQGRIVISDLMCEEYETPDRIIDYIRTHCDVLNYSWWSTNINLCEDWSTNAIIVMLRMRGFEHLTNKQSWY